MKVKKENPDALRIAISQLEKDKESLVKHFHRSKRQKMKEVKVYLINLDDWKVEDMDNLLELTDEEFMNESERQGKVYSLKGFQKAFNLEEVNITTDQMRIIEVGTSS